MQFLFTIPHLGYVGSEYRGVRIGRPGRGSIALVFGDDPSNALSNCLGHEGEPGTGDKVYLWKERDSPLYEFGFFWLRVDIALREEAPSRP